MCDKNDMDCDNIDEAVKSIMDEARVRFGFPGNSLVQVIDQKRIELNSLINLETRILEAEDKVEQLLISWGDNATTRKAARDLVAAMFLPSVQTSIPEKKEKRARTPIVPAPRVAPAVPVERMQAPPEKPVERHPRGSKNAIAYLKELEGKR